MAMVRREPVKPRPRVMRRVVEVAIIVGVLGIFAMNAWQAFGARLWKGSDRKATVTVLDDCVGGLCMTAESGEATASNGTPK
jgi:hypothetical protein